MSAPIPHKKPIKGTDPKTAKESGQNHPIGLRRLKALEARMGYVFSDSDLGLQALIHSSYGDGRRSIVDNERLEFLGDRVLGLMTAQHLYDSELDNEGIMARRLNALVRRETCARVARKIGLGDALLISPSEDRQGGRDKVSIIGDACESLIAAIYLDGGMDAAWRFYDTFWTEEIEKISQKSAKDPKTELQERASVAGGGVPDYSVIERSGPDHRPLFVIEVCVDKVGKAQGTGKSKKDAERYAALHLLENWANLILNPEPSCSPHIEPEDDGVQNSITQIESDP